MPAQRPVNPGSESASGDDEAVIHVVEQALGLPAGERDRYIRDACAGDAALFETVWKYVNWDLRMKGFLLKPFCPSGPEQPADEPGLEPGQILNNRFRIVRKVAGGGMGVVYEAWDEKLDRRIAVKCARSGFHARLSPEVRYGSEINHPNICKTWDIHTVHHPQGDFDFLTMEFIDGGTLADRLRAGPLPKNEAGAIASQICAGLAAAHRGQVIHGDLKSNNVLLARGPDGTRAVITDFGLSRAWLEEGTGAMSGQGGGALKYMAPELLQGARPSAASDIYALGVILHEMACGRAPLNDITHPLDRLTQRPALLKHSWGRTIARCLEPLPASRWASASEVARALIPFPVLRWSAIAAVVTIAAAAGAAAYRTVGVSRETVRLAVLPFTTDPDSRSLSDGLLQDTADRLRGVRDDRRKLTVIPIPGTPPGEGYSPEKVAARFGATHTLAGTLRRDHDHIAIHASLTDARSQLRLKEWDAEYQAGKLGGLPVALAGMVTGTLRLSPLARTATVNAAAYPDFTAAAGLLQRDGGVDASIPLLMRAVAADPDSPLTHARLAEAEARKYELSLDSTWLELARKSLHDAEQRNPDLPLVWLVAGRISENGGFYEEAQSDLERALQIDPRDGDVQRRLGRVYRENNRFAEAAVRFQKAIEAQPGYFPNYLDLCELYLLQGNYDEGVRQCRTVTQLVPDYSEGRFALAIAYFEAGDYPGSDSEFSVALKLNPRSASTLFSEAFALTSRGRYGEAIPLFQRAIAIGPPSHLLYSDLGTAYRLSGFSAEAQKAYRKALDLTEKDLEGNPRNAIVKAQLAYLCAQLGQRERARTEAIQARQSAPGSIEVAWWLILTWETLGSRNEALALLEHVPDDVIRRINREKDLADLRKSLRFHELMASRRIQ